MPRNTREWARRKLQEACDNINWSGTHLEEVRAIYKPDHPEIANPIESAQQTLIMVQLVIEKVRNSF